jgi:hypothetical protein
LTCDGLYASTDAEQRGLNISKLMSFHGLPLRQRRNRRPIDSTPARAPTLE